MKSVAAADAGSKPATNGTSLGYKVGKKIQNVDGTTLLDPDGRIELREQLDKSTKPVVFDLEALLDYADPIRFAALDLMASLTGARFQVSEQLHQNLLDAVLAHAPTPDNI